MKEFVTWAVHKTIRPLGQYLSPGSLPCIRDAINNIKQRPDLTSLGAESTSPGATCNFPEMESDGTNRSVPCFVVQCSKFATEFHSFTLLHRWHLSGSNRCHDID
jgi:hypothetical protein